MSPRLGPVYNHTILAVLEEDMRCNPSSTLFVLFFINIPSLTNSFDSLFGVFPT